MIGTYLKLDVASTERVDALLEDLVLGLGLFGLSSSFKQLRRLLVCDTNNNNKRSVDASREHQASTIWLIKRKRCTVPCPCAFAAAHRTCSAAPLQATCCA